MTNEPPKHYEPSLCMTAFKAVAIDEIHVDLVMRPISSLFHVDGRRIFEDREAALVHSFSIDDDSGDMCARVRIADLPALTLKLQNTYVMTVATFGRDPAKLTGYQNGHWTPCNTPFDAMRLACDHKS